METLLMIILLVHAIALLGVFCTAKHDAMPLDGFGEPLADWQERMVPIEIPIEAATPLRR
jgi:hypothetical protein